MIVPDDVVSLLDRVGGIVPEDQQRWQPQDPTDLVLACTMDLDLTTRVQFLEAFETDWRLLLVLNDGHPQLPDICRWAEDREATLVLATPSGPPAPAVATFFRPGE